LLKSKIVLEEVDIVQM